MRILERRISSGLRIGFMRGTTAFALKENSNPAIGVRMAAEWCGEGKRSRMDRMRRPKRSWEVIDSLWPESLEAAAKMVQDNPVGLSRIPKGRRTEFDRVP
jgi:hypothetical protein